MFNKGFIDLNLLIFILFVNSANDFSQLILEILVFVLGFFQTNFGIQYEIFHRKSWISSKVLKN